MQVKITFIETGETEIYDLSKNNWKGVYAAMRDGSVLYWAPAEIMNDRWKSITTSGKRWERLRSEDNKKSSSDHGPSGSPVFCK